MPIGAGSSKTGTRRYTNLKWQENLWVHRKNTRDIASSRAYSFPSSISHSNHLRYLWTNPKCNIAFSKDCLRQFFSRPSFKATLSRAMAYLQLFITLFFRTSREHDTGVSYMRICVNVYVYNMLCKRRNILCQTLLESLQYNMIIYKFKMFAHYLIIYSSFKFY